MGGRSLGVHCVYQFHDMVRICYKWAVIHLGLTEVCVLRLVLHMDGLQGTPGWVHVVFTQIGQLRSYIVGLIWYLFKQSKFW